MLKQTTTLAVVLAALLCSGAALADEQKPQKKAAAEAASAQPIDDTWITTKVKASLVADEDVSAMKIEVDTVNGVVFLTGTVQTQVQADEARRRASQVKGVAKVDTARLKVTGS